MSKRLLTSGLGLLLACFCLQLVAAPPSARVLLLISRNPTDSWAVAELDGMLRTFREASPPVATVVEYLDAPGAPPPDFWAEVTTSFRSRFAPDQFDVVIVADGPALQWMRDHHDEIFPTAQVVFVGITAVEQTAHPRPPWLTGVTENTDPSAALHLALRLQPDLRHFFILDDSLQSGRGNRTRLLRENPDLAERLQIEPLPAPTSRALFAALEKIPPQSAILLTRATAARRMGSELLLRSPVPVYGQRAPTHLGAIVAGAVIDGERHGAAAAQLALRLLRGERAAEVPLKDDVPTRFIADYEQMKRFGLSFAALPPGTEIVNRPLTVSEQFPVATHVATAALVSLTVVAAWLAWTLRQKRRKTKQLKESLSLLDATLNASADGVLVVDLNGHVVWFNRAFTKLWRIPDEVAARRDDDELVRFVLNQVRDPELFISRVKALYAVPDAEGVDTIEFKDSRVFERRASPQRVDDQIVGRVWTFVDLTARRQAEEAKRHLEMQLAHSQRLEALGTLAGGIAHDFNNLLTAILGYTHLVQDSLPLEHPSRPDTEAVLAASQRARDLVQRILTFSRKTPLERRPVRLEEVVADAIRLLRPSIPAAVEIHTDFRAPAGIVLADVSQVHQALLNLGTNAAHALRGRGGTITIGIDPVTVGGSLAAQHPELAGRACLCVRVADDGPGIDSETLLRVFDPFFTTKGPGEGTGLGLAVVHGIMQNHEGAVTLDSTLGSGTTARLYFPLVDALALEPRTEEPAFVPPRGGARVLLVDDEATVLHVAEQMLLRQGFKVTACSAPKLALEILQRDLHAFDALVTDLNMPHLSGLELSAAVTALCPGLAVVLATGFLGDATLAASAAARGVTEIVEKPYTALVLGGAILRALEKSARRRPPDIAATA